MIKHGSPPYLECSSRGEKRLSAFYARPRCLRGKSIEQAYQAMKVLPDGRTGLTWREAKGKRATNHEACTRAYTDWWRSYLLEYAHLVPLIMKASGLSDMFGRPGSVCQATVLWQLRSEFLDETSDDMDTQFPG